MAEAAFRFAPPPGQTCALILDLSRGAESYWPHIRQLAGQLVDAVAGGNQIEICCLGSGEAIRGAEFKRTADCWCGQNRGRARVIAPVIAALAGRANAVVVLATGRIFDLEDWIGEPGLQAATFVSFDGVVTNGLAPEIAPDLDSLRRLVDNPVVKVVISHPRIMPVRWSNRGFRFANLGLVADGIQDYSVVVQIVSVDELSLAVTVTRADGSTYEIEAEPVATTSTDPGWRELAAADAKIVRECLARNEYTCPHCNRRHPSSETRCTQSQSLLGKEVLASVGGMDKCDFLVLRPHGDSGVRYRVSPGPGLKVADDCVAMREQGQAHLCRFDPRQARWLREKETMRAYQPLGDGTYALVL